MGSERTRKGRVILECAPVRLAAQSTNELQVLFATTENRKEIRELSRADVGGVVCIFLRKVWFMSKLRQSSTNTKIKFVQSSMIIPLELSRESFNISYKHYSQS